MISKGDWYVHPNGTIRKAEYEVEKGKWLEFVINRDKTIMVSAVKVNHLCDGCMSSSLFMNYPMDDVLDFVVLN